MQRNNKNIKNTAVHTESKMQSQKLFCFIKSPTSSHTPTLFSFFFPPSSSLKSTITIVIKEQEWTFNIITCFFKSFLQESKTKILLSLLGRKTSVQFFPTIQPLNDHF